MNQVLHLLQPRAPDDDEGVDHDPLDFGVGHVTVRQLEQTFRRLRRAARAEIYSVGGREAASRLARLLRRTRGDPSEWLSSIERSGEGIGRAPGSPSRQHNSTRMRWVEGHKQQ